MKNCTFLHIQFHFVKFALIYRTFTQQAPETVQAVGNANTKMYLLTKWQLKALPQLNNLYMNHLQNGEFTLTKHELNLSI